VAADDIPIIIDVTTGNSPEQVQALDDAVIALGDSVEAADAKLAAASGTTDEYGASAGVAAANVDKLTAAAGKQSTEAKAMSDANKAASDTNVTLGDTAKGTADSILAEADASKRATGALRTQMIAQEELAANMAAANSALGSAYVGMSKLEALGTPAIMKAATWTVLGAGGLAYEGIKQYMNFNKLITQTVTQAGVNPNQMNNLSTMAENISKLTGVKLDDVANSMYRVASGTASWNSGLGASMAQLKNITTAVTKLQVLGAIPSGAASEQSARVVAAMINSNLVGTGRNPNAVAALVNATVGSGDMRQNDLVPGVGRGVLQSAKSNGMSAKDMMSWIALLTSMGTTASVAGNYVKTGINLLANPSAQGVLAESMIGIKPGEMQGLISSKGGLQSAVATFDAAMSKFAPSSQMVGYRTNIGNPRPGGTGETAAINKLQTWMVGEMPAAVLKQWEHGGSAASGGLTAKNLQWIQDLIMTKAFGGSKQFATLAAILKNPALLAGVETSIGKKNSISYLNSSTAIAENTPSQRFDKALASLTVDLVNAGKVMYPAVIKIVDGLTWFIGKIVTWKPALYEIGAALTAIVGFAAAVKAVEIGKGAMSIFGGLLTKLDPGGTDGKYFRNAYNISSGKMTQAELGESVIKMGLAETAAIKTSGVETAAAVRTSAAETLAGLGEVRDAVLVTSGRSPGSVGGLKGAASTISKDGSSVVSDTNVTSTLARNEMLALGPGEASLLALERGTSIPLGALGSTGEAGMSQRYQSDVAAYYARSRAPLGAFDSSNPSGYPMLGAANSIPLGPNGSTGLWLRGTQPSPSEGTIPLGTGNPAPYDAGTFVTKAESSGLGEMAGAGEAATTIAKDTSSISMLARIGSMGPIAMMGGPAGVAMIAAAVLPMAMPYAMKLGNWTAGLLGHLFGGSSKPTAPVPLHVLTSSATLTAQLAAATTKLHSFEHLVNGKWVENTELTSSGGIAQRNAILGLSALSGDSMSQAEKNNLIAYNESNGQGIYSALNKVKGLSKYMALHSNGNGPMMSSSNISAFEKSIMGDIPSGMRADISSIFKGAGGKYTPQQLQQAVYRQLSQRVVSDKSIVAGIEKLPAASWAHILPQDFAASMSKQGSILQSGKYLMNPGYQLAVGKTSASSSLNQYVAQEMAAYHQDLANSKDTSWGPKADADFKKQAQQALADAGTFTKVLDALKANKSIKLEPVTVGDLAKETARQLAAQGLTSSGIADAFTTAIGASASGLAAMINKANMRVAGTGGKQPK